MQFYELIEIHLPELRKLSDYSAATAINQLRLYWEKWADNTITVERLEQLSASHLATYDEQ